MLIEKKLLLEQINKCGGDFVEVVIYNGNCSGTPGGALGTGDDVTNIVQLYMDVDSGGLYDDGDVSWLGALDIPFVEALVIYPA